MLYEFPACSIQTHPLPTTRSRKNGPTYIVQVDSLALYRDSDEVGLDSAIGITYGGGGGRHVCRDAGHMAKVMVEAGGDCGGESCQRVRVVEDDGGHGGGGGGRGAKEGRSVAS